MSEDPGDFCAWCGYEIGEGADILDDEVVCGECVKGTRDTQASKRRRDTFLAGSVVVGEDKP